MALVDVRLGSKLALAAALLCSACGGGFDPPSEVKTLRVLGVQKSLPYPRPGDTVDLSLLYRDPLDGDGSQASVRWLPECFNPPGDLYFGCLPQIGSGLIASVDPVSGKLDLPTGTSHSFQVQSRAELFDGKAPPAPGQPAYALAFSFFAVCAGDLFLEQPRQPNALPFACRDTNSGVLLGPDRFVVGYVSFYMFQNDDFANENPVVDGFEVSGAPVDTTCDSVTDCGGCVDEACLDPDGQKPKVLTDPDCSDSSNPLCVAACADDGDDTCPGIPIRPLLEQAKNAEADEISAKYYNRAVGEQSWIDYYVDRGSVKSPVRLLNDATTGWNADYATEFYAPKEPGAVNVWAVVHDNRGGQSWAAVRLSVQ